MAEDGDVLRQIWHSYLPVQFRLAPADNATLGEPDPFYLMVSRVQYFPLVMEKVVKHLQRFVKREENANQLWLEFEGHALKWHLPIGLLWDLLGGEAVLPWPITVHFSDFPESELVRCQSRAALEQHFMSCLKEADALKHRSEVMAQMQKKEHSQLWLGLQNDRFDQFWAVNRKLMAGQGFRFLPIRVHAPDGSHTQRLIRPTEDDRPTTVADLRRLLGLADGLRLVCHGVEPPLETPLQWTCEHLAFADNFVHFCALERR